MSAPRRIPPLRWEPLPFLVVIVLLLGTGFVRPNASPAVFWAYNAVLVAAVGWLLFALLRRDGAHNPDRWGGFDSFESVGILDAPAADRELRTVSPVDAVERRQQKLDLARIGGGVEQGAVLVPRSRSWLGVRYRIGVVLEGGGTPRQAGYLQPAADARWRELLDALAVDGRYVRVPAVITKPGRQYGVDLDLSGLAALEAPQG